MNISQVTIRNFKGRNGSFDLAPVNVITGDNFAGKSAIPLAVRLALTGYLPAPIGKENRSIFEALAGDPLDPGVLEVGFEISQDPLESMTGFLRWTKNEKGTVSREGAVPGSAALPAILCEPRVFFAMSGPERVRAVFDACPDAKIDTKALAGQIGEIMSSPAKTRDELIQWITEQIKVTFAKDRTDQVASEMLNEVLKTELKRAKDQEKMKTGAVQGASAPAGVVPTDHAAEIAEAEETEKGVKANLAHLERIAAQLVEAGEIPEKIKNLKEELASLAGSAPRIDAQLPLQITQAEQALKGTIERMLESAEMVRRWTRAYDAVKVGKCPTCGCEGEEIKARIAGIKKSLDEAIAANAKASDEQKESASKLAVLKDQRKEQSEAVEEFQSSQNRINEINSEIKGLEAIKPPSAPSNLGEFIAKAKTEVFEAESKVTELRAKQTDFIAYRQNRARRDALEQELLEARCAVEVFGSAGKILAAEVAKATEKAFVKVMAVTDQFTHGLLNSKLEFREGQLGRRVSEADVAQGSKAKVGAWISHEAFSGTEELIAYAGFAVALANRAPFKLVVMDELGRLTEDRRIALVDRMAELVKVGTIHQFIGVDVDPKAWKKCRSAKMIKCA
jgi:hypothetical protein